MGYLKGISTEGMRRLARSVQGQERRLRRNEHNAQFFDNMIEALNFYNDYADDATDEDVADWVENHGEEEARQFLKETDQQMSSEPMSWSGQDY